MSLRNLLERELVGCSPDTTVVEVAETMESKNVGAVLVLEEGRPAGIVTDRDLVTRCIVKGLDCHSSPVRDVMTEPVETVGLDEGLFNVIEKMKKSEIRRVPVVDENGRAVGLLSFGDVFQLLATELSLLARPATPESPKIREEAA